MDVARVGAPTHADLNGGGRRAWPPPPWASVMLGTARVGHLATADGRGTPSVVPVCFASLDGPGGMGPTIVSVMDEKPKSVGDRETRRVRNIVARPEVALVVDDYDEVWYRLAWVLVRGSAAIVGPGDAGHGEALAALRAKYAQYRDMELGTRLVIRLTGLSTSSWRAHGGDGETVAPDGSAETAGSVEPRYPESMALIRGRRSVRGFTAEPVPPGVIRAAIEAAGWAPSPHGRQPWRFAVVESAEIKRALADAMASTWEEQLSFDGQAAEVIATRLRKSRERVVGAPVLVVPCLFPGVLDVYPDVDRQDAERIMAIQSLGAAIQTMQLQLYAAGWDSGWMCAPLFCPDIVRETLGLAPGTIPQALIPIGRAAREPVRRERIPPGDLIAAWL